MNKHKLFLILQSILCIALAVLLAAAALGIYREGIAVKADNPLLWVYTPERISAAFRPIRPLLWLAIGFAAAGMILGVKDENGLKPVKGGRIENRSCSGKTLRTVLIAAAVIMIAAGIFNGSARDVFGKAVKICTECVGLG